MATLEQTRARSARTKKRPTGISQPSMSSSIWRVYLTTRGRNRSPSVLACSANRLPMFVTSSWAPSSVAPGANRPNAKSLGPVPGSASMPVNRRGVQNSCLTGNANPLGITPTTVWRVVPTNIVRPMTEESVANWVRQRSWPRTTTDGSPGCSSRRLSGRPIKGGTPAIRNALAVISAPETA